MFPNISHDRYFGEFGTWKKDNADVSQNIHLKKKYFGNINTNTNTIKNFKNYVGVDNYVPIDKIINTNVNEVIVMISMEMNGELIEKPIICDMNNANERKLKIICSALKDDEPMHKLIKEFIIYTIGINETIDHKYETLLQYIYEKKLNDFVIKFDNNKYYKCNKSVLMTNKYFETLLSDCDNDANELYMNTNYHLTKMLIKMLYKRKKINLDPYDFCKIFELADMLLMENDIIYWLLGFVDSNIDTIINYELYKNNIDNLHCLLGHLKNIYSTDNEFPKKTKLLAYNIYKKIIELDFNIKITNADSWRLLEALIVKIPYMAGIKILKEWDFANDIYAEIENMVNHNNTDIYMKIDNRIVTNDTNNVNRVIVLNSWFPIFKVDIFEKISCKIMEINEFNSTGIDECWLTLKFKTDCPTKIKLDSKLLFGFSISSYHKNIHNVKEIIKCFEERRARVPQAMYVSDLEIYYKIRLDKFCNLTILTTHPIWLMTQVEHKVGQSL